MHILLVDDDPGDRLLIRCALDLALHGTAVLTEVHSLDAAIQCLKSTAFDLVLADLDLPDAQGLSTPRRLGHFAADTPIIVMTGTIDEETGLKAIAHGAQDFLAKAHFLGDRGGGLEKVLLRRAIRHAIERQRLRYESRYDGLTGVLNRRGLQQALDQEVERARRQEHALFALFLDCDDFKSINDTKGYDAGDETLRWIATQAAEQLRPTDVLARFGGDEFIVLLPAATHAAALDVAHRLRSQVEKHAPYSATVSVGLVSLDLERLQTDTVLQQVQGALQQAKRAGKNQVVAIQPRRNASA